jgi:hypothetical protein
MILETVKMRILSSFNQIIYNKREYFDSNLYYIQDIVIHLTIVKRYLATSTKDESSLLHRTFNTL